MKNNYKFDGGMAEISLHRSIACNSFVNSILTYFLINRDRAAAKFGNVSWVSRVNIMEEAIRGKMQKTQPKG